METYLKFDKRLTARMPEKPAKSKKPQKPIQRRKPIAKVGIRKKERIRKNGTESALFESIWISNPHECEICGSSIQIPLPECFSHRLSKGRYPEHRYNEKNIALVCSKECHAENDRRNAHRDAEILDYILS